jgi:hypothetical protein
MIITAELQNPEQLIGQILTTFDNKTHKFKFDTIAKVLVQDVDNMYTLILDTGKVTLTGDHIVYTDRGHLMVRELTVNDYIQTQFGYIGIDMITQTKVNTNGIDLVMTDSDNYCMYGIVLGASK